MSVTTKFLTVVWGEAYIKRFATLSMPSYLASGNIPALAKATDLEIVIMTSSRDIANFETYDIFRKLREICNIQFIEIDDLITTSIYGVTLSLAYARAVIECGADMINTHFVFMNADFILADGSLRSLSKHILDGRSVVLGPSLRVTAETTEPHLYSKIDRANHSLTLAPRKMVKHALQNLHPTTLAKIINQNLCHSINPNQFFWRIDNNTLLSRYHLIFMLCIKPEHVINTINSYCDYGFIPEMCPSGDIAVMDDSDRFLMLELQHHDQELSLLRTGRQSIRAAARSLGRWTTAEHRRTANYDIVFHSEEIPPALKQARIEAEAFVRRIQQLLPPPLPHAFHYHWIHGVQAWKFHRNAQGLSASPPELEELPRKLSSIIGSYADNIQNIKHGIDIVLNNVLSACQRKLIGSVPYITSLHPEWLDYRLLRDAAASVPSGDETHLLIISVYSDILKNLLKECHYKDIVSPEEILTDKFRRTEGSHAPYTHIFIYMLSDDFLLMRQLLERCQSLLQPDSECLIFLHNRYDSRDFSRVILKHLDDIILTTSGNVEYHFVGGRLKSFNQKLFFLLRDAYVNYNQFALIWIIPTLLLLLSSSLLNNLYLRKKSVRNYLMHYCSSMLIRVKNSSP